MVLYSVIEMSIGPLIPTIGADLHIDRGHCGLIFSTHFAGYILAVIAGGYLGERVRNRFHILLAGCVLMIGSCLALWAAKSLFAVSLVFCILGMAVALLQTTASALCADLNHARQEHAIGVLYIFFAVGAVLGPVGCAFLLHAGLDWRWMFMLPAAGGVVMGLVMMSTSEDDRGKVEALKLGDVRLMLRSRQLVLSCIAIMLYVGVETAVWGWMADIVHEKAGLGRALSAVTLSLFWFVVMIGRVIGASMIKKTGAASISLILTISCLFTIALLAVVQTAWHVWVAVPIIGLSFSAVFAGLLALGTTAADQRASTGAGMMIVASGTGGMIIPAIAGFVSQSAGFSVSIGMLIVIQVVLVMLVVQIKKGYQFAGQTLGVK